MTGILLEGRPIADGVLRSLRDRIACLPEGAPPPHLAFVMIGTSPPAEVYIHRLEKLGARIGADVSRTQLPPEVTLGDLERTVSNLNSRDEVDGILVEMPLPDHLVPADLSGSIDPRKDVDGITVQNVGRLYLGIPGQSPPTALAMMEILATAGVIPTGRHAVVVGRSSVVGHPVTEFLLQQDATVTVVHRQTPDLAAFTRQAEILMVGAGEPGLIHRDMITEGVVIIDAGINVVEHGVRGDVAFDECKDIASAITPVPGGVGPVTNAMLLRNLVDSAERRRG